MNDIQSLLHFLNRNAGTIFPIFIIILFVCSIYSNLFYRELGNLIALGEDDGCFLG